ncbi:MAG: hypothetical protein Q4A52_03135 [Bacillota bacterium]|nr:hypothetical protein [Bacillota bacterium]
MLHRFLLLVLISALALSSYGCQNPISGMSISPETSSNNSVDSASLNPFNNSQESYYIQFPKSDFDYNKICPDVFSDVLDYLRFYAEFYLSGDHSDEKYHAALQKKYGSSYQEAKHIYARLHLLAAEVLKNKYIPIQLEDPYFAENVSAYIKFSLRDINLDGHPELILSGGEGDLSGSILAIYSIHKNGYSHLYTPSSFAYLKSNNILVNYLYQSDDYKTKEAEFFNFAKKPNEVVPELYIKTQKSDSDNRLYVTLAKTSDESVLSDSFIADDFETDLYGRSYYSSDASSVDYVRVHEIVWEEIVKFNGYDHDINNFVKLTEKVVNKPYLKKVYSKPLNQIYEFLKLYDSQGSKIDRDVAPYKGIINTLNNLTENKTDKSRTVFEYIGYAFYDVTGDDTPELIILNSPYGLTSSATVEAIYAINGDTPTLIYESYDNNDEVSKCYSYFGRREGKIEHLFNYKQYADGRESNGRYYVDSDIRLAELSFKVSSKENDWDYIYRNPIGEYVIDPSYNKDGTILERGQSFYNTTTYSTPVVFYCDLFSEHDF